MTAEAKLTDILAALDIAAIERREDGSFRLISSATAWLTSIFPHKAGEAINLRSSFFLDHFLQEAESFWQSGGSERLRSGPWNETRDLQLEASALLIAGRKILLIEPFRLDYGEAQPLAQKAREKSLDYERLARAEESLRRSEARNQAILDAIPDLMLQVDGRGAILEYRPKKTLDLAPALKLASRVQDVLPAEIADPLYESARQAISDRATRVFEVSMNIEGRSKDYEVRVAASGADTALAIVRDITRRKQLERELIDTREAALAASRAKSDFLARMSHEIRTPLNGVIGMIRLLVDAQLTAEQQRLALTAQSSAAALLDIINDLLDLSKIEAGKTRIESQDFNLRDTVEEAVEMLAERAHAKGLELVSFFDTNAPALVRGDAGRIRQIIVNLAGNAIKFTRTGEVAVKVARASESERRAVIRFEISDTGIGISAEAMPCLFHPFSQADPTIARRFGGTGLGLAISKQLVDLMGGEIGARSQEGKGSSFWFTLPLEKQLCEIRKPDLPLRAIIIDRNATSRKALQHYLLSLGARSDHFAGGAKALEIMRRRAADRDPYDAAFINTRTRGMDGAALADAIKSDPALASTRVVMMKPFGNRSDASANIDAQMTKPVRLARLVECIRAMTNGETSLPQGEARPEIIPAALARPSSTRDENRGKIRVLLAEDNPVNQEVALLHLQRLGYGVETVSDGREAIRAFEKAEYDIVLMDCQMPDIDGYEATREIRLREGQSRRVAIIAMTANALEGEREKCLAAGMDDYLTKPLDQEEMAAALRRWAAPKSMSSSKNISDDHSDSLQSDLHEGLRKLAGGSGSEAIIRLIDLFIKDTGERLADMRAAKDEKTLGQTAHALKGSCGYLGATRMKSICEAIEDISRAGAMDRASVLIDLLEEEFARVCEALEGEKEEARRE
jgi:signal transduction histidine kinase/DNA-binding response OmpR family regulator